MATELVEKLVAQWLPEAEVDFLTERCTEFAINVPGDKANNQQYLVRLVSRHLYSETLENSPDQGKAVWLKLFGDLGTALGKGVPKIEPPDPAVVTLQGNADPNGNLGGNLTFHKLREFKINGTVDGGKAGTLQYVSLYSQIKLGEAAHYTSAEIIYGVIRAIPAASSFRTLLETNLDMDMPEFIKLLRSHYKEQDSDSALLELKGCYQLPDQGAHDFCCKAIFLRDRLQTIAEEEGSPWDPEKLRKRLFRTIATGLKQNGIKIELQPYLSEESALSDREFLERVTLAEVHEEERLGKVKTKEADIAAMLTAKKATNNPASERKSLPASAKNAAAADTPLLPPEITEYMKSVNSLTTKIDQLTSQSAAQFNRIKTLENMLSHQNTHNNTGQQNAGQGCGNGSNPIAGSGQQSGSGNQSGRKIFKCKDCISKNVGYCHHCFKCNGVDHKAKDCPKN